MIEANRPLLHLVFDQDASGKTITSRGHFEPFQHSLLEAANRTLFLCTTDSLTEQSFLSVLSGLKPRVTIDLRISPRFDFGALNRRRALALFEGLGIVYFDVSSASRIDDRSSTLDTVDDWTQIVDEITSVPTSNVVVLADSSADYRAIGISLGQLLRDRTGDGWEVVLQGPPEAASSERRQLFISHANPDDNDFALWLQAQLTRRGYEVWCDLTHLGAGETFWNSIEDTIRLTAAKVIAVASRASMTKPGVLDEISLAVSVERSLGLDRFVVPIRIDDLPFSDFRANIARKNTIDFSVSWARGLTKLIDTLERDCVPSMAGSGGAQLAEWWHRRRNVRMKVESKSEELISNQFELRAQPERLFHLTGSTQHSLATLPVCPFHDGWLSLYSANELSKMGVTGLRQTSVITTVEFLSGSVSIASQTRTADRERIVIRLLNRIWESCLTNRGLLLSSGRNGTPTAYIPKGLLEKDQSEFVDGEGNRRKRLLVGRSEKRKVHWHLGVIGRFKAGKPYVLQMKMRVIFTEDGRDALVPIERMTELRRAFCKNWWNDRWRSLQTGLAAWLCQGQAVISLHQGDCGVIELGSRPQVFLAPIAISEEDISSSVEIEADDMDFGSLEDDVDAWGDAVNDDLDVEEVVT